MTQYHTSRAAAAALALFAPLTLADVTLYGVIDETLESVSAKGANDPAADLKRGGRVGSNSSLIGFRGGEELGDGLKAIWQVESGIAADTGGGTLGTRDTFVGLAGRAGTLQLGLLTSSSRAMEGLFDINRGATGIGSSSALLGKLGNLALGDAALKSLSAVTPTMQIGLFDNRVRNAVQYLSPGFNGFSASALYGSGENAEGPSAYTANLGLKYDDGALYGGVSYTRVRTGADAAAPLASSAFRTVEDLRAALVYRFSAQTRVGAIVDRSEGALTDAGAALYGGRRLRQSVWYVNGSLGVAERGRLIAQYGRAGELTGGSADVGGGGRARHYQLGYEHDLSRRTMVKALYSAIRNEGGSRYDYGLGSVGSVAAGADPRGFALGLRHAF
ncbi:porin [Crenobacter luteus]|uniref:Porin domain-containing protein n=1 Tax=Crenobacter luteus TaxID=1452487 RepID=A0A165ELU9_9NEIS|nr:porin [Crenobacter luteus]KZE25877.1 hypothetical protein AVW16_02300 [Crenobacter luteus]